MVSKRFVQVSALSCAGYCPTQVWAAVRDAAAAVGGIRTVVSPGSTVLVKPNLLSPRPPADAVTTHPSVVHAVVELVKAAGAARIWIADSCAGDHSEQALWDRTGMAGVADATGAELKSFRGRLCSRAVPSGGVPVPAWLDEVDAVISVPKLKTHALTGLTCAMKNTFGLVAGGAKSAFHGSHPSPRSMSRFLVQVHAALRPDFFIVDAIEALEGEGPANGDPKKLGLILAATDGAAVDTLCAAMLPGGKRHTPMLQYAAAMRIGATDRNAIEIVGDGEQLLQQATLKPSRGRFLLSVPEWLFKPVSRLLASRPRIQDKLCVKCGICADICSQDAIRVRDDGGYMVDDAHCILCMCCAESCPRHAIALKSPFDLFRRIRQVAHALSGAGSRRSD